ncbi:hypothetical protein N658DRAFT_560474 [Parathielavia hyrcaniae]|uniref:Uncharacterized protein n=1 Tax=Parathielavia hyrcaniae TaxID=113614 RepID=A0AAN6PWR8_9PEZI|nr:hypothetical protein N658DRAFT_560474 [Parathielavia hyrcaniae]
MHRGVTIITLDGNDADQSLPPGDHVYEGPVIINYLDLSHFRDPGRRTYHFYGPVTINYIGRSTYKASLPGHHWYDERVTVNYTDQSLYGAMKSNKQGTHCFMDLVYNMTHYRFTHNPVLPGLDGPQMLSGREGGTGISRTDVFSDWLLEALRGLLDYAFLSSGDWDDVSEGEAASTGSPASNAGAADGQGMDVPMTPEEEDAAGFESHPLSGGSAHGQEMLMDIGLPTPGNTD